ncbi:MAG: hypothetical protein U1F08_03935 [Steroidobacteraceae bacterium]
MRISSVFTFGAAVVSALVAAGAARAQAGAGNDKWYSVATSASEVAYVNVNAIKRVGTTVEVKVKENFTAPRPAASGGKTFLSTRTLYRLDCGQRKIAMSKTEAFAAADLQGEVVQKASRNDRNLIWMDAPTATVFGEILDYGCRKAPAQ